MCGRARQVLDWSDLKIKWWAGQTALNIEPRWNAAPRQRLVAMRQHETGDGAEAVSMRWGFIPYWEKDPKGGRQPINAKMETIVTNGMWRGAFKSRRCIFPVSGFYEWQERGGQKTPYSFDRADGGVMYLGGLWSRWKEPGTGDDILTFAVITGAPNELVADVHDRMPLILEQPDIEAWLSGPAESAAAIMRPCPAASLVAYQVSDRIGNVRNEGPELAQPLSGSEQV